MVTGSLPSHRSACTNSTRDGFLRRASPRAWMACASASPRSLIASARARASARTASALALGLDHNDIGLDLFPLQVLAELQNLNLSLHPLLDRFDVLPRKGNILHLDAINHENWIVRDSINKRLPGIRIELPAGRNGLSRRVLAKYHLNTLGDMRGNKPANRSRIIAAESSVHVGHFIRRNMQDHRDL